MKASLCEPPSRSAVSDGAERALRRTQSRQPGSRARAARGRRGASLLVAALGACSRCNGVRRSREQPRIGVAPERAHRTKIAVVPLENLERHARGSIGSPPA